MSMLSSSIEVHSRLSEHEFTTVCEYTSGEIMPSYSELTTNGDRKKTNERAKYDDDDVYEVDSTISSMDDEQLHELALEAEREKEAQQLYKTILCTKPTNDTLADVLLEGLHGMKPQMIDNEKQCIHMEPHKPSTVVSTHPYPPIYRMGLVSDHDRPYADYGHMDRATIAKAFRFKLQLGLSNSDPQHRLRLYLKALALVAITMTSKEEMVRLIRKDFGSGNIQYICVGESANELGHQHQLEIQIILKRTIARKRRFLDEFAQIPCNYQVTTNDRAWNEYIKQGLNFIEFGHFKSTSARGRKHWPRSCNRSSLLCHPVSSSERNVSTIQWSLNDGELIDIEREHQQIIAKQLIKLAETNIHSAMDFLQISMREISDQNSSWYRSLFQYVHLLTQIKEDRTGHKNKIYMWPNSFPHCTPRLRKTVNRWIRHHFSYAKRGKCLILIGPPNTGKTSFALSLPGRVNYFNKRWNSEMWSNYARYSVYDNIPWDQFEKLNFPDKRRLLCQGGRINVIDRHGQTIEINVRQPSIVLLRPEDAQALLWDLVNTEDPKYGNFWRAHAFIYIMGPDEYFHESTRINTQPILKLKRMTQAEL